LHLAETNLNWNKNLLQKPKLVAHRGYADKYPENSMVAFCAAIDCGCRYLELDVQISKDEQAVIIHDTNLERTGDLNIDVLESNWSELQNKTIGEPRRFGDTYKNEKLFLLIDFVTFMQTKPEVHVFVEIKEESIEYFGEKKVLDVIRKTIEPIKKQCSLISFDSNILFEAKKIKDYPIGYVIHKYDQEHFATATKLSPDILICNYKKIPDENGSLWQGSWDWLLYEIIEPEIANKWAERGVKYIETMQILPMIKAFE
jgi:glycerophosphoryl diester phosphodiesterase